MEGKILPLDEVKRIAKEYVQQEEHVQDVEVRSTELSSVGGLLVYVVQGKARKKGVEKTTTTVWQAGVEEECSFSLQVSARDGSKIGYKRGDWPSPPVSSQQHTFPMETVVPLGAADTFDDGQDWLDREADRDNKKSQTELNKAIAARIRGKKRK